MVLLTTAAAMCGDRLFTHQTRLFALVGGPSARMVPKIRQVSFKTWQSSPFWDVDFISSDGVRTWNVVMSGLDNEANDVRVQYLRSERVRQVGLRTVHSPVRPQSVERVSICHLATCLRLAHLTDHGNVITNDLNVGQDYAIRVEELDAKYHGKLMDNVTWRMDVWSQRKFGERQENATAHCFNFNAPRRPATPGTFATC